MNDTTNEPTIDPYLDITNLKTESLLEYQDYICLHKCNYFLCKYSTKPSYKIFQNKCDNCNKQYCKFCNILVICYDTRCLNYMNANCLNCFCVHQKKIFQDILYDSSCDKGAIFKHIFINRLKRFQKKFKQKLKIEN